MVELTVKGHCYKLELLDAQMADEMLKWARAQLPDPVANVKDLLPLLPPEAAKEIALDAYRRKLRTYTIADPEIEDQIKTPAGCHKLLRLLLCKHQPDMSDGEVWDFHSAAVAEHGERYLETCGAVKLAEG